ncbi:MAG: GGDEF domain-containing protein [Porticoccaceae bacterium]
MEIQQKIDKFLLLCFLVFQQLIAIVCAIYYFHSDQTHMVIFFIAICSGILLTLAFYCALSLYTLAKWTLLLIMVIGHMLLIAISSDQVSSIWCLTTVPVIGLLLGHIHGAIVLITIFICTFLYLLAGLSPFVSIKYDGILVLRFLFSYGLLMMLLNTMEKYRFPDLKQRNFALSKKKKIELQDILTKSPHRHCMEEHLRLSYREYELGISYFCVILADIDNCREINDRYGRALGDLALKKVGQLLLTELRENDMAGRWSGNQFILVLPEIAQNVSVAIAERIRQRAHQIELCSQGDQVKITLSIGICSTAKASGLDDLLSLAENCVYQAKQMGRNMVITA